MLQLCMCASPSPEDIRSLSLGDHISSDRSWCLIGVVLVSTSVLLPQYFSAIELLRGFMGVGKALDFLSASVLEIIKLRRQQKEQYKVDI